MKMRISDNMYFMLVVSCIVFFTAGSVRMFFAEEYRMRAHQRLDKYEREISYFKQMVNICQEEIEYQREIKEAELKGMYEIYKNSL